ncbi:MAG: HlyD family efflux transporter periplasmic adaptor subunit [Planctomycetota bacterium]
MNHCCKILLGVALFSTLLGTGCKRFLAEKEESAEKKEVPISVTVEPVELRSVQRAIEAVGTLHGYEEVLLSAKVGGRVRKILHDVGDRVTSGESLLEIDPTDYELAARQAEKALQVELLDQKVHRTGGCDQTFIGTVSRINPSVDTTTRTFEIEITVRNQDRLLKSGSFAKAAILTRVDNDAVTVLSRSFPSRVYPRSSWWRMVAPVRSRWNPLTRPTHGLKWRGTSLPARAW